MEKDHGRRFSEETYASREDIQKAMNMTNVDSIWDRVCLYRSYYTRETMLTSVERVPFSVVLTGSVYDSCIRMEKRLSKLLIKYSKDTYSSPDTVREFESKQYVSILRTLARNYEIRISDEMILAIVNESVTNIPVEYLVLDHYYKTLNYFKTRFSGAFSLSMFMMMYTKLRGIELDVTDLTSYYRKNELTEKEDHVLAGQHYEAAPSQRIEEMMNQLFDFLNTSPFMGVINAVIAYFMVCYIQPFDYFSEEMALLLAKAVLGHYDNDEIASFLPLEDVLSENFLAGKKKALYDSEMNHDFTYLIHYLLPLLDTLLKKEEDALAQVDSLVMYTEQLEDDTPKKSPVTSEPYVPVSYPLEAPNISYKREVSLPTMPVGLDEADAEMVARHLTELYPTMKKGQAVFYSHHCTMGKYYTIAQYKKEMEVAYETARTSMDNLVSLGFYKKENIRNKYVYTPTLKE